MRSPGGAPLVMRLHAAGKILTRLRIGSRTRSGCSPLRRAEIGQQRNGSSQAGKLEPAVRWGFFEWPRKTVTGGAMERSRKRSPRNNAARRLRAWSTALYRLRPALIRIFVRLVQDGSEAPQPAPRKRPKAVGGSDSRGGTPQRAGTSLSAPGPACRGRDARSPAAR